MDEDLKGKIILCQPDSLKGCSLCCGLFVFKDISVKYLSEFLSDGKNRERSCKTYTEYKDENLKRDISSYICPYQGFLADGKPGCLIHPLATGIDGRDRSLFTSKICSGFLCPAHSILSYEEKVFLIKNVDDWYIYTVAIADPESYSFIYNYIKEKFGEPLDENMTKKILGEALYVHGENLSKYNGGIFSYSVPEYNINKKNFSLKYIDDARELVLSVCNAYM
jgi:hypothetical protein